MLLRSLSADAVDVGARGKVRSTGWRKGHNPNVDSKYTYKIILKESNFY